MSISKLALTLFAGALVTACSSGMSDSGDDVPGGDDDGEVAFTNGVSTLAGAAEAGYIDGGRRVARFANPVNVAYRDGLLYVADFDNNKLRVIDVDSHNSGTIINQPGFKRPFGMAFASDGTLYVSTDNDQAGNHTAMSGSIWKVDVEAKTAVVVANAIGRPRGLAVLPDGRLAVADYLHHVIQIVDVKTGQATPIAGTWDAAGMVDGSGLIARFSAPYNIVVRGDGKLIVTDFDNNRIRLVGLDGSTSTLSGTAEAGFVDGSMAAARFSHPQAMAVADNGDIYVTDLGNYRVRRIVGDRVDTIAGSGKGGATDSDDRLASELYGLEGITVVPDGSMVYIADGNRGESALPYNRVRQIKL
jgi:DNA-binding beta-propeller fold protein YncE